MNEAAAMVTIIGLPLIIVTMIFLIKQTVQLKESLRIQAYQAIYDKMIDIEQFFVANYELKPYFHGGQAITYTELKDINKVESTCEMLLDLFEEIVGCNIVMSEDKQRAWACYMKSMYTTSKVMQDFVEQKGGWYTTELVKLLKEQ